MTRRFCTRSFLCLDVVRPDTQLGRHGSPGVLRLVSTRQVVLGADHPARDGRAGGSGGSHGRVKVFVDEDTGASLGRALREVGVDA
jgi:hypothetical protein